jgi:hypothetical protein
MKWIRRHRGDVALGLLLATVWGAAIAVSLAK